MSELSYGIALVFYWYFIDWLKRFILGKDITVIANITDYISAQNYIITITFAIEFFVLKKYDMNLLFQIWSKKIFPKLDIQF